MTERFNRAFNALTTAYFDGKLEKGVCSACAIGNICGGVMWSYLFETSSQEQIVYYNETKGTLLRPFAGPADKQADIIEAALLEIGDTGYSWKELAQIEKAFEQNTTIDFLDARCSNEQELLEDQYKGLAAVVDILCELDGIETVQEHKAAFRKHPKLATV
jgi:hypothetical protein